MDELIFPKWIEDIVIIHYEMKMSICSVVVITVVSHTTGPQFEPGQMQEFMSILIFIWIVQLITNEQLIWNDVIETGNAQTCNGRCNQMDRKIDPFISWRYKNIQTKANFPNLDSTFDTKFRLEELQPETI